MSVETAIEIPASIGDGWWPPKPYGPAGWLARSLDLDSSIIVSVARWGGGDWIHASISHRDTMPTYLELLDLHRLVFGSRWAIQVFAPPSAHVSIHDYALHLWGRVDGARVHPDFGFMGTI